jgi:hypothetical protein
MNRMLLLLTYRASRLTAWLARHRGGAQLVAGVLALGFGLWGWTIRMPPTDAAGWFNNVFRTIQLVTLQFPTALDTKIPWQLQAARLAVPLVAALATFNILVGAITRPVRLALLTHTRDHVVVCGADQVTHAALARLAARGTEIAVVEPGMALARREILEGIGLTVVDAEPREPATMGMLNLGAAAALFLLGEDDMENLNTAMRAAEATAGLRSGRAPLVLAVRIEREDLAGELATALDTVARRAGLRYQRVCPDRDGLLLALAEYAPVMRKPDRAARSHVLLVGLQGAWRQVLAELLAAAQDHPLAVPLFSLALSEEEAAEFAFWRDARPELALVAEFVVLARGVGLLPGSGVLAAWRAAHGAPDLVVVLRDDADGLATSLALRRPQAPGGTEGVAVLVRQSREDVLLSRLAAAPEGRLRDLVAFGGVIRTETLAQVLDREGDALAIALHDAYLAGAAGQAGAAVVAWDELAESLRDANRAAAAHAPVLLAAAGLKLAPAGSGEGVALDEAMLDAMARIEHRRWMAERIERGWRRGAARDDARHLHPLLLPFDALDAAQREGVRAQVRTLADAIARTGRMVVRG